MKVKSKILAVVLSLSLVITIIIPSTLTVMAVQPSYATTATKLFLKNAKTNNITLSKGIVVKPTTKMTRTHLAAIITKIFGATDKVNSYKATNVTSKNKDVITKAIAMGMFSDDSKFSATKVLTRQEAFLILQKVFNLPNEDLDEYFADIDDYNDISKEARGVFAYIANRDLITIGSNKLFPNGTINYDNLMKIINSLAGNIINKSGKYTKLGSGNVTINTADVTIEDVKLKGNLIIGDGVGEGDVTIKNTSIPKNLVIRGGGENSVKLTGKTEIKENVITNKPKGNVRLSVSPTSTVNNIIVESNTNLDGNAKTVVINTADVNFKTTAKDIKIEITAENVSLNVESGKANVTVSKNAKGAVINVSKDATISVVANAPTEIKGFGEVSSITANTKDIVVDSKTTVKEVILGEGVTSIDNETSDAAKPNPPVTPPSANPNPPPTPTPPTPPTIPDKEFPATNFVEFNNAYSDGTDPDITSQIINYEKKVKITSGTVSVIMKDNRAKVAGGHKNIHGNTIENNDVLWKEVIKDLDESKNASFEWSFRDVMKTYTPCKSNGHLTNGKFGDIDNGEFTEFCKSNVGLINPGCVVVFKIDFSYGGKDYSVTSKDYTVTDEDIFGATYKSESKISLKNAEEEGIETNIVYSDKPYVDTGIITQKVLLKRKVASKAFEYKVVRVTDDNANKILWREKVIGQTDADENAFIEWAMRDVSETMFSEDGYIPNEELVDMASEKLKNLLNSEVGLLEVDDKIKFVITMYEEIEVFGTKVLIPYTVIKEYTTKDTDIENSVSPMKFNGFGAGFYGGERGSIMSQLINYSLKKASTKREIIITMETPSKEEKIPKGLIVWREITGADEIAGDKEYAWTFRNASGEFEAAVNNGGIIPDSNSDDFIKFEQLDKGLLTKGSVVKIKVIHTIDGVECSFEETRIIQSGDIEGARFTKTE